LPRINYDANGENGALLLEPQRANLNIYSEDITNATWDKLDLVTTNYANVVVSPDGYTNADKIIPNTTSAQYHGVQLGSGRPSLTGGTAYTYSIFAKAEGYDKIRIQNFSQGIRAQFNLTTGTLINQNGTSNTFITPYGNGWYRIGFTYTQSTTQSSYWNILVVSTDDNSGSAPVAFAGNGTDAIAVWGSTIEAGSYATSYIPNHSGTGGVTRAADLCLDGGSAESINSTEGVLYAEISALAEDVSFKTICLHDGTATQRINIWYWNDGTFKVDGHNNNVQQFNFDFAADLTALNKIAVKYKANDFSVFLNGSKINSDTSGATPIGLNTLDFRNGNNLYPFYGNVKQVAVFDEALSDSELATLTTL